MKWAARIGGVLVIFPFLAFAADTAVSFATAPLWLSSTHITEGKSIQISTVVMKTDADSAFGIVAFFADGAQVGTSDFSLSDTVGGAVVALSWTPGPGKHAVSAKIANVTLTRGGKEETLTGLGETKSPDSLVVDPDNDRDGIPDVTDPDDDNDGTSDVDEKKNGTNPLKKEEPKPVVPQVAGAATTTASGLVDTAKAYATQTGNTVFAQTEALRAKGSEYLAQKLSESEKDNVDGFETATTSADGTPVTGKIPGWKGMVHGGLVDALKVGAYIFNNIYLFYIILIVLVLFILRKIWRRFSID